MSKKAYVRPVLVKQVAGVMNKFGNSGYRDFRDTIDGVKVESLVKSFGSPLFVLERKILTVIAESIPHFHPLPQCQNGLALQDKLPGCCMCDSP